MTAETSQKLADALRAIGLEQLADRALNDEFHDYLSPHDLPLTMLVDELAQLAAERSRPREQVMKILELRSRVINGDFDASEEEAEAWAQSDEGKATIAELTKPTGRKK